MVSSRDFNFSNEEDCEFAYEILQQRYLKTETVISGHTPPIMPSYIEHKNNLKTLFKTLRIALIDDIKVGLGYIDKKDYVGFFYEKNNLKKALKNNRTLNIDFSKFFLQNILSFAPLNTKLYARVSNKNKLANITASRLMSLVSNSEHYNTYMYTNE
jgi:hypothetical protein